ncbi:glycoside hydrolase family 97 protein [Asticcacaulis sp. ZE23SCel15]|uniref:glycoside hydrolase family 97 protein n=1 Tax=Asticcacaulis sp. ZE23SCel15 TaxID=3059027 RepID=UPI00265E8E4C|nr:glycoside hydrolase family 97 protein [Asticcacaulis sp. ZE23SCel15]WKL56050.1 glycoside hydrolase family 97 protein [Asticcacaulis sp. ZE23SCel15]
MRTSNLSGFSKALCLFVFTLIASLVMAISAYADQVATAISPGGELSVRIMTGNEGHITYAIDRKGVEVISPSKLGFILADQPKLERNMALTSQAQSRHNETWELPWGERQFVRNDYNELRLGFTEKTGLKRQLTVVFRLYDNGFGFRYEFPDQPQLKTVKIVEELTEFTVTEPATAWWIPAGEWNRYEYLYNKTPLSKVSQAHTPITLKTTSGLHMAFHEAALVDYSAMWLRRVSGQTLKANLSPHGDGPKVTRAAPFNTPWRTVQMADTAGGLVENDLVLNLNEPNALGDVSWVKPYKYVGIWWDMHLNNNTWSSGPKHGATTKKTKNYIDFAAKNGLRGVLVEGWNMGWDGDWFANGDDFDFTKAYPDFDIEGLAAYAKKKKVHIVGHHETAGNIAVYEPQLEAALDLYQRLGIDSIKTGYVADAGGVKARDADGNIFYTWHDGQIMARHHLKVVVEAAKRKIAINPHEPIKDTGLRRTYPNWVAREGARGMEYNAWGQPPNPPEHEINLVFTRLLSGPMDYTPGILSLEGAGQPLQSSVARQLALYVVIYSPIQMAADTIENYRKHMKPFQFIKDVPTDWADTKVLNGEVGDYVTIVRKDKASADWYLGAATDEAGRTLEVALNFLESGKVYTAQIYRDADDTDYRTDTRHHYVIEQKTVTAADRLTLKLAPGGGQAIRFVAAKSR